MTREEQEELSEADQAYLFEGDDEVDEEERENERIQQIVDPYVRKRALRQSHQEYRQLSVGH